MKVLLALVKEADESLAHDEELIKDENELVEILEQNQKYVELVAPVLRFCFSGSFMLDQKNKKVYCTK